MGDAGKRMEATMEGEDGQSIEIRPRATELKDKGVGDGGNDEDRRGVRRVMRVMREAVNQVYITLLCY
jgi:hypothetical protein